MNGFGGRDSTLVAWLPALRGVYIAAGRKNLILRSCFGKAELERLAEAGDEHFSMRPQCGLA
jgi:hypothetical protein